MKVHTQILYRGGGGSREETKQARDKQKLSKARKHHCCCGISASGPLSICISRRSLSDATTTHPLAANYEILRQRRLYAPEKLFSIILRRVGQTFTAIFVCHSCRCCCCGCMRGYCRGNLEQNLSNNAFVRSRSHRRSCRVAAPSRSDAELLPPAPPARFPDPESSTPLITQPHSGRTAKTLLATTSFVR